MDGLLGALTAYSHATTDLVKELSAAGLSQVTPERVVAFRESVKQRGLPQEEIQFLRAAKLSQSEIDLITQMASDEHPTQGYDLAGLGARLSSASTDGAGAFRALLNYGRE